MTGTGLGKERDGEKEEESKGETERDFFFYILYAQPFLLAQLVGNPRCCIRLAAELKVMSRDFQQPGNLAT